jgi:hypothetical protein
MDSLSVLKTLFEANIKESCLKRLICRGETEHHYAMESRRTVAYPNLRNRKLPKMIKTNYLV